jgi:hypothetical protein
MALFFFALDIALGYGGLAALACVMTLVRPRNPRTLASS